MSCCDSEGHVYSHWNLWLYLVMFGLLTKPGDVTWPQILMLYNQEVWMPQGTFLVITCWRNRCPNTSPKVLCDWSLSLLDIPLWENEQRNILHEIRKRKANWIGHILRRNCLLKQVIEGKIGEGIEVTRRRGRRRKKLLDDLKDRRGYSSWCRITSKVSV
jgi:hypothetical protein